jgi:hypothetical protein
MVNVYVSRVVLGMTSQPRHHGGALLGDSTRDGLVHAYDRIPSPHTL